MSRTKNAAANIILNFSYQIINIILNFILREVFIYTLGVDFLGINSLFTDVLGMLSVIDLGFNTAMLYSFYKPIAEGNKRKIAALVTFYKGIYNKIAWSIAIVGVLLTPFIPFIVNTDKSIPHLSIYYLFALTNVVISYLYIYKTTVLIADQKNYVIVRITIFTTIFRIVVQIILLLFFKNYILYLIVGILTNFLANYIASNKATKIYPFINERVILEKNEITNIFKNIRAVFIYKLSSVLLTATDNIIISILVGTEVVGYYSNYLMIQNKIVGLISLLFTSLTAGIGNLIVTESEKKRYDIFKVEQTVSFIICGVVIPCFYSLIEDLVSVWLGFDFALGYEVALVVSMNMYLGCVLQPLWSYREATGLYSKTKWIMSIAAVLNIFLSILLGSKMGIVGIILASIISRVTTYVWYEPKLLFRLYFKISSKVYLKDIMFNLLAICFLAFLFRRISLFFIVTGWFSLCCKGILYVGVSFMIMLTIYRNSEGIKWISSKLKRMKEGI